MARLPEQRAWDNFSGAIDPTALKLYRVENICVDGMSDVVGINRKGTVFWIENKALVAWPALSTTFPMRDVFEPGQLPFLRQWKWWKGHGFVLLRVGIDFYLLDPNLDLKAMTALELMNAASHVGKQAIFRHLETL